MTVSPRVSFQRGRTLTNVHADVGDDSGGSEYDLVLVGRDIGAGDLFSEVGYVVAEPEEVLLVLVRSGLTGDRDLFRPVVVAERAEPFNCEHIRVGNAVVEDEPGSNYKVYSRQRKITRRDVGRELTPSKQAETQQKSHTNQEFLDVRNSFC